jgi:hypothetical protein
MHSLLFIRHIWEDNIKTDLQDVGLGVWIGLIWLSKGQEVDTCKGGNETSGSIKCVDFSTR